MKYDESNNPIVRTARVFTDKVTDVVGTFSSRNTSLIINLDC